MDLEEVFAEAGNIYGAPRKRPKTSLSNEGPFVTIATARSRSEEVGVKQLRSENDNLKKLTSLQGKQLESLKDVEHRCKRISVSFEELKEEHRGLHKENKQPRKTSESKRKELERQKAGVEEIRAVRKENEQLKNDLHSMENPKASEQEKQALRKENEQLKKDLDTKETELNCQNRWEKSTFQREKEVPERDNKVLTAEENVTIKLEELNEKDEKLGKLIHTFNNKMAIKIQVTKLLEREKIVKENEKELMKGWEKLEEEQRLHEGKVKQFQYEKIA